eukprot:CAMPEP_0114283218 /NCGR_PEP_ID=MMETSP0059-20121206/3982_1 /TAXON_ID=36894 /ORGANISM="Pyramimonas parkeae, Strain CCMP726" /LENGTH=731 /DNA_ID=CAMNT_0001403927 /DNA_START=276 /DNA_END=2475 /DNA_ORIENTATION=+
MPQVAPFNQQRAQARRPSSIGPENMKDIKSSLHDKAKMVSSTAGIVSRFSMRKSAASTETIPPGSQSSASSETNNRNIVEEELSAHSKSLVQPSKRQLKEQDKDSVMMQMMTEWGPETLHSMLHEACESGDIFQVEMIVESGLIDINEPLRSGECVGQTGLHKAVRFAHVPIVRKLLDYGALPTLRDQNFRCPFYYAAFSAKAAPGSHQRLMGILVNHYVSTVNERNEPRRLNTEMLLMGAYSPHPGVMDELLDALQRELITRNSDDVCEFEFHDLHLLNNPLVQMTWPDGSKSKTGETVLSILVSKGQKESVAHPHSVAMLKFMWEAFAKKLFLFDFVHFLLMFMASSAMAANMTFERVHYTSIWDDHPVLVPSIMLSVLTLSWTYIELKFAYTEFKSIGKRGLFDSPEYYLHGLLIFVFTWSCCILQFMDDPEYTDTLFQIAAGTVVLHWLRLTVYAQMSSFIGPFFIMIQEIVKGDLVKWLIVILVYFPGFALALNLLYDSATGYRGEETYQAYDGWGQAMFTQWLSMYGLFAYPREEDGFFLVGIIAVSIVLLNLLAINLLIAMMNATYSKIAERSVVEWNYRYARYILRGQRILNSMFRMQSKAEVSPGPSSQPTTPCDEDDNDGVVCDNSLLAKPYRFKGYFHHFFFPRVKQDGGYAGDSDHELTQQAAIAGLRKDVEKMQAIMERLDLGFSSIREDIIANRPAKAKFAAGALQALRQKRKGQNI